MHPLSLSVLAVVAALWTPQTASAATSDVRILPFAGSDSTKRDSTKKAPPKPTPTYKTAKAPYECVQAYDAAGTEAYKALNADKTLSDADKLARGKDNKARNQKQLRGCLNDLDKSKMTARQLTDIVTFGYNRMLDDPKVRRNIPDIIERAYKVSDTPQAKADVLLTGVKEVINEITSAEVEPNAKSVKIAEGYAERIDAMPVPQLQAQAHAVFVRAFFPGHPVHERHVAPMVAAAQRALEALPTVTEKNERRAYTQAVQTSANAMANRYGRSWQFAEAAKTLEDAAAAVADTGAWGASPSLREAAYRFTMIGKPAVPFSGDYWLNAPAGRRPVQFDSSAVTLLEFTTTWCGWCKKGYPTIRRLGQQHAAQGFRPMFVTVMEQVVRAIGPDTVKAEQEVAYDEKEWVQKDSINFPVAIIDPASFPDSTSEGRAKQGRAFLKSYAAEGFPTYVFVDRKGIVRYVQVGHSRDLETNFAAVIKKIAADNP